MVGVPNTLVRHHTNGVLHVWCVAHHNFYSEVSLLLDVYST